jgi:hypothetical protein
MVPSAQDLVLVRESLLFRRHSSRLRDVHAHKWFESEKAGHDVGFSHALIDWIFKHASNWEKREQESAEKSGE